MFVCILGTDRQVGCAPPYLVRYGSPAVREKNT